MIKVKNNYTWEMVMPILIDSLKSGKQTRIEIAEDELMRLAKEVDALTEPTRVTQDKPKKRKAYTLTCDECGKKCNGRKGLAIHRAATHGYHSPNYEKNKNYRENGTWTIPKEYKLPVLSNVIKG